MTLDDGATTADAHAPDPPAVIRQEIAYALWRTEEQGDRALYPEPEWWAVRMEHPAHGQPDQGRMTGAERLTAPAVQQLLRDPHGLSRVTYQSPDPLLAELAAGRRFSNMTGWTHVV